MNMMVNASELVVSEAETNKIALKKAISKLVASWETKQAARAKKVGGFGLLAVSLAACNSSSDDTATTTPATPTTPTTPAAPTVNNITVAAATTNVFGTADNDIVTATGTTLTAAHIIADSSTSDADVMNVTTTGDFGNAATVVGIETVNFILESVTALGTTADAIFEAAATNMAAGTFTMDVNKVGSPITSGTITGLATGSTVTFSDDFSTAATVTGDDNAALTVTASSDTITANTGAGAATATTMTGTDSAAAADTTMVSNSDAAATFTTTASDMTINATAATTVVATSAGDIDANTNDLTAATSVTLTSAHEMDVGMAAAASATLSAGGTTNSTIDDAATGTLKTVNLSGNGSAHNFDLTDSEGITTINFTGSQNVTAIVSAADIDALTSNKITVTDNTADAASANITTTLQLGTAAGDVDATAAAVDAVTLAVDNNAKTLTVASGATVVIAVDQTSTTIDGPDAGAASNSVTISMNDGNTAANDTPDIGTGLTITDFKTATIDASVESTTVAGATLNDTTFAGLTASADNTNLTIKGGSNTMTLSGTHSTGTGAFIIESDATVALGASDITAGSFTHTGSGAVTWTDANSTEVTTISTGSGNDAITLADVSAGMTINTGAGDDTITLGQITAASKSYVINGGDGADTLLLSVTADTNNGTAFTLSGVETVSIANGVTAVTVGSAMLNAAGLIFTHATPGDNVTITVEMGTANSVDMSSLTFDTLNLGNNVNDSLTISNGAATAALTVVGASSIKNTITTGSGNDQITGGSATFGDVLSGGAGNDTISGGDGTDTLNGNAGTDTITGGKGADIISGDAGADTLTGGAGNDIYVFDAGDVASGESIVEGASDGTDDVIQVDTTTDFSAMAASSFDEVEQIDINANSITGTFTAAQLTGETIGLHTVAAGTATAVIINLTYGETATLSGITNEGTTWTSGEDTITINGVGGNETITGTGLNDTINGAAGDDTITPGEGIDSVTGGDGNDTIDLTETTAAIDTVNANSTVASADSITGFANGTGVDVFSMSVAGIQAAVAQAEFADGSAALANGSTVVIVDATAGGNVDIGAAANSHVFVKGDFASTGAVETAIETGGSNAVVAGAMGNLDAFLVLYDDGTDSYLAQAQVTTGTLTNGAAIASGALTVSVLATFKGIADADTFVANDFAFVT